MADALLETAITNWEPRFTANGVDASDYQRITSPLERWDQWCAAWTVGGEEQFALGVAAEKDGRRRSAGEYFARAATYFHFGKFLYFVDLDEAKATHMRAVDALTRALPLLDPLGTRIQIPFKTGHLVGVLRRPRGAGPHPVVILIPGLDSTKEEFRDVEPAFLNRGMATFAVDGPGQGESEYVFPIQPEWDEVGAAVIATLEQQADIDASRIGVWGVSFGSFYAGRVAAADLPVKATIALAGPYDFGEAWPKLNPLTRQAFTIRSHSKNEEAAGERAKDMTLVGYADKIKNPILVIGGALDRLFDRTHPERLAAQARGESELLMLEDGNHGCANVIYKHRPYGADWMARHLGLSETV
jgi:dienelactone hydrolase